MVALEVGPGRVRCSRAGRSGAGCGVGGRVLHRASRYFALRFAHPCAGGSVDLPCDLHVRLIYIRCTIGRVYHLSIIMTIYAFIGK